MLPELADMEGVVSVLPNTMLQLHTTRSWDFIGLPSDFYVPNSKREGMIKSGYSFFTINFSARSYNFIN